MCGVMLRNHGYNVTILEQEISPRREGYDAGIKVGPANEEFLKRHDRVKRDMIIKCDPGFMIDVNGRPKPQHGQTMLMTSWGLMVSVLRANFDGLTSTAVPVAPEPQTSDGKADFRFGTRVTDLEDIDGRVKVSFMNANSGTTEVVIADIAVVADGSNSAIRRMLLPDVKREYSGYMCWRGTVREGDIDEKWNSIYSEKATFHLMDRTYLLK
jgi:2-polyprenyl-6-methoxyphenol hydroxylase-like FAD-dependent oxidoreductase